LANRALVRQLAKAQRVIQVRHPRFRQ
jgi:hypothetical protein